jgi:response regulator NasT
MRVLVADDDPVIALALAERVRSLGHEPIGPVANGAEAVSEATASRPDLYLFDVEMPELDGLEAAARLTAEGLRRPVVIVTGLDDPALVDRSIAYGVGAYLTKPVTTRQLDAALGSPPPATRSCRRSKRRSAVPGRHSRIGSWSSARRAS